MMTNRLKKAKPQKGRGLYQLELPAVIDYNVNTVSDTVVVKPKRHLRTWVYYAGYGVLLAVAALLAVV